MYRAFEHLLNFLFGCRHSKISRPFTMGGSSYCNCLTCGASLPFSVEDMCFITPGYKRWKARRSKLVAREARLVLEASSVQLNTASTIGI